LCVGHGQRIGFGNRGSVAADVVTSWPLLSVGVRPKSCRAAAIIIHGNGDSTEPSARTRERFTTR
jgi:hypothetical protein